MTDRTARSDYAPGVSTPAKSFDYAVSLDSTWDAQRPRGRRHRRRGRGVVDARAPVLAGLARCTLTSLRYHCVRADHPHVERVRARNGDETRLGRAPAFVETAFDGEVSFEPRPDEPTIAELLAKAERDCFVGASLTAPPVYSWRVE